MPKLVKPIFYGFNWPPFPIKRVVVFITIRERPFIRTIMVVMHKLTAHVHVHYSPFIMLCLLSIEIGRVISEPCYKGTVLHSTYSPTCVKDHLSTKTTLKSSHQEMLHKEPLNRDHLLIKTSCLQIQLLVSAKFYMISSLNRAHLSDQVGFPK